MHKRACLQRISGLPGQKIKRARPSLAIIMFSKMTNLQGKLTSLTKENLIISYKILKVLHRFFQNRPIKVIIYRKGQIPKVDFFGKSF